MRLSIKSKKIMKRFIYYLFNCEGIYDLATYMKKRIEIFDTNYNNEKYLQDKVPKMMSEKDQSSLNEAVTISFVGDLILLKQQILAGWSEADNNFDFSPIFEYTKDIFNDTDYSIGILEGPLAGKTRAYSNGNYADGSELRLNYPDIFVRNIKEAGINMVSLANNHMFDNELAGALRTTEILTREAVDYIGIYKNKKERNQVKIVDIMGLKIAFIAYMDGQNYMEQDFFISGEYEYVSPLIVNRKNKYYSACRKRVQEDFETIKMQNPNWIVVLPHMGDLGKHHTNAMQKDWNDFFITQGADLILTASSHAVQPIEWVQEGNKNCLIVNCPGNFVNSRMNDDDDDASAIVRIFLDKKEKKTIAASLIPLYAQGKNDKLFQAVPIYKYISQPKLRQSTSQYEWKRIEKAQRLITRTMIGADLPIETVQKEYYYFPENGGEYVRKKVKIVLSIEKISSLPLYIKLSNCKKICFIGDSITHGTRNGGYGWYEPLVNTLEECKVDSIAWGGATTVEVLVQKKKLQECSADIYVIALGTNDIRYRNTLNCAMTCERYVENIKALVELLRTNNLAKMEFIIIAPWYSLENDIVCNCNTKEKEKLFSEYTNMLKEMCIKEKLNFVDPNPFIKNRMKNINPKEYLVDYIHPNANKGIQLYCMAVLEEFQGDK